MWTIKKVEIRCKCKFITYQAFKNNEITVLGGKQIRPNIHIDDMVSLYNFAIKNKNLNGIYNAGFENISILDIAKKISKITGCKISIKKSNDPRSYRLDSSKIVSKGFKPRKNVDTAIHELISFFKKVNFKKNYKNINLELMQKIKVK